MLLLGVLTWQGVASGGRRRHIASVGGGRFAAVDALPTTFASVVKAAGLVAMTEVPLPLIGPTGVGQMAFDPHTDSLFITSLMRHTVYVVVNATRTGGLFGGSAEKGTADINSVVSVFAGADGNPTFNTNEPPPRIFTREAVRFENPSGIAPVCQSAASARERYRMECRPFAILISAYRRGGIYLAGLREKSDGVRLVAGSHDQPGHVQGPGPFPRETARFVYPCGITDMLDGGGFAIAIAGSHCVVRMRPLNLTYGDVDSFGRVNVTAEVDACGPNPFVLSPPDGTLVYGVERVLMSPISLVVHPLLTSAYLGQMGGITSLAGCNGFVLSSC